ncbi:MAG: M20/M25/M40 family metallo-hydrolase [Pirellulales bacterium]
MTDQKSLKVNRTEATKLVKQLLAIPGKSGEEAEVAQVVRQHLIDAGVPATWISSDKAYRQCKIEGSTTGNLIVNFPGTVKAPRRMLMAHMDTVPICVGCKPVKQGTKFVSQGDTGLGADDRAGVAVVLNTAKQIMQKKLPHPPLTFLFSVQEEVGLQGARHIQISKLKKPKLAFNWDGGNPYKLTVGAIGGYRMTIDIHGIASHAGVAPEKGTSAVSIAALAIAKLHEEGWLSKVEKSQGSGTSNIGVISGGSATNVVVDHVRVLAEARSHNVKFMKRIVKEIEKQFKWAAKQVKNVNGKSGRIEFDGQVDYEPFKLPDADASLLTAEQVIQDLGQESVRTIANGGLDANWLFKHGVPTVSLGCGQLNQHMVTEQLEIPWYLAACQVALQLAAGTEANRGT